MPNHTCVRNEKRFGHGTFNFYSVNDSVGLGAKKFRVAWSMGLPGIIGIAMFSVYTITKR